MQMQPLLFCASALNEALQRHWPVLARLSRSRGAMESCNRGALAGMAYWLMKSEPGEVSIDDVLAAPQQTVAWFGIRNYQARNFMRDAMRVGDGVLFYHSSCAQPGIVGIAEVVSAAYPDPTQFDPASHYFDPKATPEQPRWMMVDVKALKRVPLLPLSRLRGEEALAEMALLQRGNRLSITRVTPGQWRHITANLLGVT